MNLLKNTFFIFISSILTKCFSVIIIPIYTSILSAEDFGIIELIFTTVNFLYPFFTLAIYESTLRFLYDKNNDKQLVLISNITINVLGSFIFIISQIIFFFIFRNIYIVYLLIYYLPNVLFINITYILRGLNLIKMYAICSIINGSLILIFILLFLLVFKGGILSFILSYSLAASLSSLFIIFKIKLYCFFSFAKFKYTRCVIWDMLKYSIPLIPNSVTWWLNNFSDRFILAYFHGNAAIGLYAAASKLPSILSLFTNAFNLSWQVSAFSNFDTEQTRIYYAEVYNKYTSFVLLTTSFAILSIKLLSLILFKGEFYNAWNIGVFLVVSMLFYSLSTFLGIIFTCTKKTRPIMFTTCIGALLNLSLNVVLIPYLSGIGAGISTLASCFFIFISRLHLSRRIFFFYINFKNDIICYFLIVLQALLTLNGGYWAKLSFLCFIIICILRMSFFVDLRNFIHKIIYKINEKNLEK